jgi:Flp pilus assembly protein TadD
VTLLHHRGFLALFACSYVVALWFAFLWFHNDEIAIRRWFNGELPIDHEQAAVVAQHWMDIDLTERHSRLLGQLADVLLRSGNADQGIRILERLVTAKPGDAALRMHLALILHQAGRFQDAERHFGILLEENATHG